MQTARGRKGKLMQFVVDFVLIFMQNLIFRHLLGLPAITFSDRKQGGLLRLGILTTLFCTICAGLTAWARPFIPPLYQKLLFPLLTAVIAGTLDLLLVLLARCCVRLDRLLLPQLHNAAFSGTVLGAVLLSTEYTHEIAVALRFGLQTGLGFFAACLLLAMAAPACYSNKMPQSIRGTRGLLLYTGLLCMAAAGMFPV